MLNRTRTKLLIFNTTSATLNRLNYNSSNSE